MRSEVLDLHELDEGQRALAGGKGAGLGALAGIDGVVVPPGFCVTTDAFRRVVGGSSLVAELLEGLGAVSPDDGDAVRTQSAAVRAAVEATVLPPDLSAAITAALAHLGDGTALAVRSSATAEDLPTASFAGQQDTYLNVVGADEVLLHVRRCWASLFTERAVTYRIRNGIDHRTVQMAVVVQQLVLPRASGVLFTADPITGNRKVAAVEATVGLGEALVSGRVDADSYRVRDGAIVERRTGHKQVATVALASGGTEEQAVAPGDQAVPALADAEVLHLAALGRRIEAALGRPQDIEWCLVDDGFRIVQSRPITTLFPAPAPAPASADDANHVYVSVGHQQMMTDPMKPLGLNLWQLKARPVMHEAAGRLFVDVTPMLAAPASRAAVLGALGTADPLVGDALQAIVDRDGFLPEPPPAPDAGPGGAPAGPPPGTAPDPIATDPAVVTALIQQAEASIAATEREIRGKAGPELLAFILEDIQELKRVLWDPVGHQALMSGMDAAGWLNEHLLEWLGEKGAVDTLSQSVANNVTSEMGLALLDVADAVRPHPEVIAFLEEGPGDDLLDRLPALDGGDAARGAIVGFLARYGMRCVGEIDLTRPRWNERPSTLVPLILGNVRAFEPGEGRRRFEQGRREAEAKAVEVLARLRALPDGDAKADEAAEMIARVRTFAGFREFPKYAIVCRSWVYKQALLAEADRLVAAGLLRDREDADFLSFAELQSVAAGTAVDGALVDQRKEAFATYQRLVPPRVLTSEGEAVRGTYRRTDVPEGALVGLAVSTGTVEGRARVVHDLGEAAVEPGDILVTAYTDPSWSPLFVAVAGLVTEVGGLMTHGAVIAREYGLPAVVGVEGATRLIRDGQRIRVHGTEGHVELID
ncbi:phosphoenolpyruvate synthase [Aquihabitans sp. G128]|uniref:rifamycin-inactivating phosphotransferase n=1 Tax=Aquihabitans sp. G128 TaxID=2849779 RepID=UPI001C246C00|nr:rifamycin-inactivating phosphotransferase [Aquihabitans sp. G128]QXC60694.1 phosphoenolpyruvate synthase [Aquihabitans sp. G128]